MGTGSSTDTTKGATSGKKNDSKATLGPTKDTELSERRRELADHNLGARYRAFCKLEELYVARFFLGLELIRVILTEPPDHLLALERNPDSVQRSRSLFFETLPAFLADDWS